MIKAIKDILALLDPGPVSEVTKHENIQNM